MWRQGGGEQTKSGGRRAGREYCSGERLWQAEMAEEVTWNEGGHLRCLVLGRIFHQVGIEQRGDGDLLEARGGRSDVGSFVIGVGVVRPELITAVPFIRDRVVAFLS